MLKAFGARLEEVGEEGGSDGVRVGIVSADQFSTEVGSLPAQAGILLQAIHPGSVHSTCRHDSMSTSRVIVVGG